MAENAVPSDGTGAAPKSNENEPSNAQADGPTNTENPSGAEGGEGTTGSVDQPPADDGGGKADSESKPEKEPANDAEGSNHQEAANGDNPQAQSDGAEKTQSKLEDSAVTEKKEVTESSKPEPEASGTEPSQPEASGDSSDHPLTEPEVSSEASRSHPETSGNADQLAASGRRSTGERRSRKKSRRSSDRSGAPALRRRTSRMDSRSQLSTSTHASGVKHLEIVILSVFQPSDPQGTGFVQAHIFWELLQSSLQLTPADISQLRVLIPPDQSGLIPYAEFASHAVDYIASLHTNQPPADAHWVELATADGGVAINYNKQTGEVMDKAESSIDIFASVIEDLYQRADSEARGYVNWKMFKQLLLSAEMSPFLQEQDVKDMQEQFKSSVPNGKATFGQFRSLARELILRVYRAKDPSDNPWCKISSPEFGEVWFNKFSGVTHRGLQTGDSHDHEIAFVNEAYAKVEEINFELEQYREQNLELSNQLAKSVEDQEVLAAQLYDTGRALDEANNEIIRKENDLDQMVDVIRRKDQEAEMLQNKLDEMEVIRTHLTELEQELQNARDTIANRDSSITERDANIVNLRRETEAVTDNLKTAHGEKDAKDSALATLQHQFQTAQKKLLDYERAVPELESDLSAAKEQLENSKQSLEEKTVALIHARKHLRNARERNMVLEKEMEKLGQTHEKLCSTESEIRTLKTFLTTKTALIEKHKKDLRETRLRVAELEEKDAQRAVILADVLEKTARQYQQQLGQTPRSRGTSPVRGKWQTDLQAALVNDIRPCSAPAVPPDGTQWAKETDVPPPSMAKSFTTGQGGPLLTKATGPLGRLGGQKNRSRTVPKLPPISRVGGGRQQRTRSFVFPTSHDLRRQNKLKDIVLIEHTPSNPQCACELCRMNATVVGHARQAPETGLTGMSIKTAGLPGYQGETDVRELALAEQLRIGQRVLVKMKKSEFDLEPSKLAGIIKYVGKIDSEYVDHRIYVGVKLDHAVGDTDGLVKGKRYFTCPAKHGKIVRITNVKAVLPHKSVFYKSLQEITKRSPYTTVQKKLTIQT